MAQTCYGSARTIILFNGIDTPTPLAKHLAFIMLLVILFSVSMPASGQISARNTLNFVSNTAAFSYSTTNTYAPKSGALVLAVITTASGTSGNANSYSEPTSVSGNGLNWDKVETMLYNGNGHRVSVYRALTGATPTITKFTVNYDNTSGLASDMRQSCIIQIITVLGANLGGTNGSAAISNIGKNTGTNTGNLSASVTAITNPGTAMLGIFCTNQNSTITGTKAGWIVVSDEKVNPGDASSNLVGTTNTYDGVAVATAAASNWAGIALKVEPADVYNNFPCSSIITATNNQNFSIPAQQTICIAGGTATGLTASLTHDAAVLVVKSGTPSFSNVTISKHAEMVIDKDPNAAATTTVSFPNGLDLQDSSNLFIANGAKVIVNGDLTLSGNGGNVRVFGELEVTGNVTIANFKSAFFVGLLAKLTIGGTMRLSSGKVLINGGQLKVNTLEINGSTSIEMSQNAKLEATIFNKNSQLNSFVTGPGGGCLGMVGPNGELAQNGFQPLTNSSALKVCLPSSGVTIASNFTTSLKGSATVTTNCASCDIILGGGPLPITLTRFDGNMLSTGESHLAWSVANNNDVSSFAIEYSTNGRQFEQVASLQKAISSNYQLQHTSTHNGLIYYRLLLIDKQGKSTYSRIITLLHGSEKNTRIIGLSPTVTTNNAKLELYAATGQTIAYTIIDAAAHRVKTEKKTVQKGLQQLNIDVHGLPPGLLFIKIQTQDGEQGTMKIMKL